MSISLSAAMDSEESELRWIISCVLLTTLSSAAPPSGGVWTPPGVCYKTKIQLTLQRVLMICAHGYDLTLQKEKKMVA